MAAGTGRAYLFGRAVSKQRQWEVIGRWELLVIYHLQLPLLLLKLNILQKSKINLDRECSSISFSDQCLGSWEEQWCLVSLGNTCATKLRANRPVYVSLLHTHPDRVMALLFILWCNKVFKVLRMFRFADGWEMARMTGGYCLWRKYNVICKAKETLK